MISLPTLLIKKRKIKMISLPTLKVEGIFMQVTSYRFYPIVVMPTFNFPITEQLGGHLQPSSVFEGGALGKLGMVCSPCFILCLLTLY